MIRLSPGRDGRGELTRIARDGLGIGTARQTPDGWSWWTADCAAAGTVPTLELAVAAIAAHEGAASEPTDLAPPLPAAEVGELRSPQGRRRRPPLQPTRKRG